MHPIERLRAVARAGAVDPVAVARHAAGALLACAHHPAELVVACRRLLDRQPGSGPLWWVCSVALTATEPRRALHDLLDQVDSEPLTRHLGEALDANALLVDACLASPSGCYVSADEAVVVDEAAHSDRPLWVIAGPGVVVPPPVWDAATRGIERVHAVSLDFVDPAAIDAVVTDAGVVRLAAVVPVPGFPIAPELFGRRP